MELFQFVAAGTRVNSDTGIYYGLNHLKAIVMQRKLANEENKLRNVLLTIETFSRYKSVRIETKIKMFKNRFFNLPN